MSSPDPIGPIGLIQQFEKNSSESLKKVIITYRLNDSWKNISYGVLRDRIQLVSSFLKQHNIRKGERIAVILENRPEWPIVFFAGLCAGAVLVPVNPASSEEEIKNILNNSESVLVFLNKDSFEVVSKICQDVPSVKKIVSVDADEFKDIFKEKAQELCVPDTQEHDLACILYTSGTTAEPKGVMLSHKNLMANCESIHKLNIIRDKDKDSVISVLPLHHVYSLTITVILPLLYAVRVIYPGSLKEEILLEAMRDTKATIFIGVPQIFALFYKKVDQAVKNISFPVNIAVKLILKIFYNIRKTANINLARYFLYAVHEKFGRSMRLFISGGAKLDETVADTLFKYGFTVLEGYGLTETSPALTFNPVKKTKIGSAGKAVPNVELKIVNKDENGRGEVIARGPNIMQGYYKREDLTIEVIKDGWFYTGDIGHIDDEGYLFITGRLKEMIVLSSGENIYPAELEELYCKYAPIKEMCIFERYAEEREARASLLWAVVVPDLEYFRKYGEVNLKSVIKERLDNVSRTLSPHMRIMGFTITLDDLPRTLLGKIRRFLVKDMYGKVEREVSQNPKEMTEEDQQLMQDEAGITIIKYLKKETNVKRDIVPADLLELDLGIDSLGRIEIASGLEKALGMRIENRIIGEAFTVRDLIKALQPVVGARAGFKEEEVYPVNGWKEILKQMPLEENLSKIDLNPGWRAYLAGFIFVTLVKMIFKLFYGFKAQGKENVLPKGKYIFYANHTSYFDGFLVAAALPHMPRLDLFFVGFRPYFRVPVLRRLIKVGRIIPIDFSAHFVEALRSSVYVMANNKSLCLFPEGIRSLSGEIMDFKKGFGILAKESNAELIPILLQGAYEAWPRTAKFPKRHPLKVKIGKPVSVGELEEEGRKRGAKDEYEAICLGAREKMIEMKSTD